MVIYKITNLLNKKIYIGQTKQPIERRFIQHSKADSPLGQAMRKFWIKVLKNKSPNGYNLANGGGAGLHLHSDRENSIGMTLTGKRLKALREARGLSQAEVAVLIGVGRTAYLKYKNGENKPVRKLNELAKLFNVSIDFLLGNDNQSVSFENYLGKEEKNNYGYDRTAEFCE